MNHQLASISREVAVADQDRRWLDTDISAGLLFYTSFNELTRVQAVTAELRQLFIARNELASYIYKRAVKHDEPDISQVFQRSDDTSAHPDDLKDLPAPDIERTLLPEPIDHPQTCSRCYTVDTCMLFRKVSHFPSD